MEQNSNTNNMCGLPKEGEFLPDIGSDPNFVFVSDPNFDSVRLIDLEGNIINVNSWIECAHYVKGGWSTSQPFINSEFSVFLILSISVIVYFFFKVSKRVR
ncbi:hypothetical protein OAJ17_03190 [Acidimicrobiaceae bacterium]|nr:hypothetical protein [Acidimicrobiaceae bacterium]